MIRLESLVWTEATSPEYVRYAELAYEDRRLKQALKASGYISE